MFMYNYNMNIESCVIITSFGGMGNVIILITIGNALLTRVIHQFWKVYIINQ